MYDDIAAQAERDEENDRCGCGSRDIVAGSGGEPYCDECWDDLQQGRRDRKLRKDGLIKESFVDIAGCLWLYRRDGDPERVVIDSSYLCEPLFQEVEAATARRITKTEMQGERMILHLEAQ